MSTETSPRDDRTTAPDPAAGATAATAPGSPSNTTELATIVELAKRRGLVFPTAEIYGGVRATWDFGPLGYELKENVKKQWWRTMVQLRDEVVGMEQAILGPSEVWEASGHLANFSDPLVECAECHHRFRSDHLREEQLGAEDATGDLTCPNCGEQRFGDPRNFNLMFKTHSGPLADDASVVWMRPETAQGMFVDFVTIQRASRKKPPFGIAQMGKSFRNEITPGNFIFRTREFEQMEMEYFVEPGTDEDWHQYWIDTRMAWYVDLGIRPENLRIREHGDDELSHYAKRTVDVEYFFADDSLGWNELEGIANRSDFDLEAHSEASGNRLEYFDQANDARWTPYVIEPAAGATRATLAFLIDAYTVEQAPDAKGDLQERTVLKLDPRLAPIKVAVLPLSKKDELRPTAREVFDRLKVEWMCDYDETQSIGRRYRRHDEVGTPFCVTVDFDTIDDRAVTVRDRDTMEQVRVPIDDLAAHLRDRLPR